MNDRGEGKDNLTAHTTKRIKGYILARSRRLDMTASKFTSFLLNWWLAQGAPPITEADKDRKSFLAWDPDFAWETGDLPGAPAPRITATHLPRRTRGGGK